MASLESEDSSEGAFGLSLSAVSLTAASVCLHGVQRAPTPSRTPTLPQLAQGGGGKASPGRSGGREAGKKDVHALRKVMSTVL